MHGCRYVRSGSKRQSLVAQSVVLRSMLHDFGKDLSSRLYRDRSAVLGIIQRQTSTQHAAHRLRHSLHAAIERWQGLSDRLGPGEG